MKILPESEDLTAYIDGSCDPNGRGAFGIHVEQRRDGTLVTELSGVLNNSTSNRSEYAGLIALLRWAVMRRVSRLVIKSDSQLLARQMAGAYKVRNAGLVPLHAEATRLARQISHVSYRWIPREQNSAADALARAALRERHHAQ